MIHFSNLIDAVAYQRCCPICQDLLEFDADTEVKHEWFPDYNQKIITFHLGDFTLKVDYNSSRVLEYSETRSMHQTYSLGSTAPISYSGNYSILKNDIFGVRRSCTHCCQYSYLLQVHVSTSRIDGLFLNSETISIERIGERIHEIKNNYISKITEYTPFNKEESDGKTISLPLIPLDRVNPEKTLERIKALVIFS